MTDSTAGSPHIPRKFIYEHRMQENEHGSYNEWVFDPEHDYPVRCFECNRLMDPDFLAVEMECPNCRYEFSKQEARDAAVEAQVVNENYTGWSKKILDRFEDTLGGVHEPAHVNKDLEPVAGHKSDRKMEVAKEVTAWANEVKRTAEDPARAFAKKIREVEERKRQAKINQKLRQQSSVNDVIFENPYTD